MSKKFFRCPVHGPVGSEELICLTRNPPIAAHSCGKKVEAISEAWESTRPFSPWEKVPFFSERMRAFGWASGVFLGIIALAFLIRRISGM